MRMPRATRKLHPTLDIRQPVWLRDRLGAASISKLRDGKREIAVAV
jgi:hypothetical protein